MIIIAGTTAEDKKTVDKTFVPVKELTGNIKADTNVINPVFVTKYDEDLMTCNYIYSADYSRYYFIDNIEVMTGGRMAIYCHVDVLNTYKNDIRKLSCVIARQEHVNSPYIQDEKVPVRTGRYINEYSIGSLEGQSIILTVNGG